MQHAHHLAGFVWVISTNIARRTEIARLLAPLVASVGTCADASEFLGGAHEDRRPGCLLIDQEPRDPPSIQLITRILDQGIGIPFVVLIPAGSVRSTVRAMRAGAFDCIDSSDCSMAVRSVLACLENDAPGRPHAAELRRRYRDLTHRELQVLELLFAGATSKTAAFELSLSKKTVDFHRARIIKKLGVGSLIEAAVQLSHHRLFNPSTDDRLAV